MLYLNHDDVLRALPLPQAMEAVESALRIYESGAFAMPDRMAIDCGEGNLLLLMPSVADAHFATKLVTVFPGNRARGRPVIDGIVVLADRATGEVLALMDGKALTATRTGAVTGLSVRYLASPEARSVGLVGCGVQGYYQVRFACVARDVRRVTVFDVRREAIPPFVERLRGALPGVEVRAAASARELAQVSEILITATTARAPVFPDDPALFVGRHCVAIGSFEPDVREYPDALFRVTARAWVDTDYAKEESGELGIPLRAGLLREEQIETLGHLICYGQAPERGAHDTTFFKTVGMALFDLAAARAAYVNALAMGLGIPL